MKNWRGQSQFLCKMNRMQFRQFSMYRQLYWFPDVGSGGYCRQQGRTVYLLLAPASVKSLPVGDDFVDNDLIEDVMKSSVVTSPQRSVTSLPQDGALCDCVWMPLHCTRTLTHVRCCVVDCSLQLLAFSHVPLAYYVYCHNLLCRTWPSSRCTGSRCTCARPRWTQSVACSRTNPIKHFRQKKQRLKQSTVSFKV